MRKNSLKSTMINSEVMKTVSEIIRGDVKDPRVAPMTSVTDEEVTTDLKYATIYVSVLGDDEQSKKTLQGLKSSSGFIRKELARRLNLRNTPELKFVLDESLAYGMKMDKLIDEVIKKDEKGNE